MLSMERGDFISKLGKSRYGKLFAAALSTVLVFAWEPVTGSCQDVMFVLDASQSMNDSDKQRVVPDCVRAMMTSLEPSDRAGVIVYETGVNTLRPLGSPWEGELPDFSGIVYQGYTNTGAAMARALESMGPDTSARKTLVLLTDGEIMMPDAEETLHSAQLFAETMEKASRMGVPVYILSIKNGPDETDYKLYTGYAKGETVPVEDFLKRSRQLAREDLGGYGMELFPELAKDPGGRITGISADLPVPEAENVRVVITATMPGQAAPAGTPLQGSQRVQTFRAVPYGQGRLAFAANYPPGTELTLDAVPEMQGRLLASLERDGKLLVTPVSDSDEDTKLLADAYFDGKKVHLKVNGDELQGTIENGTIVASLPGTLQEDEKESALVSDIRFEELGVCFLGTNSVRVPLERSERWPWLIALLGALIVAVLLWLNHRKEEEPKAALPPKVDEAPPLPETVVPAKPPAPPAKAKPTGIPYLGRLVIYITKTPDDSDIPPLEFNLARQDRGRELTVAEVLRGCGVAQVFKGAENIIIGPIRRGIYVQNSSGCTITKRGNIILRDSRTELDPEGRIHIAFSDEVSEMIMVYKDLKTGEH